MIWIFCAFVYTKKIGLKKLKKNPRFLAIFENIELRFGPLKIQPEKSTKSALKILPTTKISKVSLKKCGFGGPIVTFFWETL